MAVYIDFDKGALLNVGRGSEARSESMFRNVRTAVIWIVLSGIWAGCSNSGNGAEPADAPDVGAETSRTVVPCDFSTLPAPVVVVEENPSFQVGGFLVHPSGNAALRVVRTDDLDKEVFATPQDSGLLAAALANLQVKEEQGSFSVEDNITASCSAPEFAAIAYDGANLQLSGSFTDVDAVCQSLAFKVRFCEAAEGHLQFSVNLVNTLFNVVTLHSSSLPSERVYGLGEQFPHDTLNLKGRRIPVLVQEGGVGRGQEPVSELMEAVSPGSSGSEDTTYYPAPHFFTSRNRSLFLENTEYSVFDFSADDSIAVSVYSGKATGRILFGESPLELIERFTDFAGRMPPLPDWVNSGAIVALARDLEQSLDIVEKLQGRGAELAAVWNQTWSGTAETFIGAQVLWNWALNTDQHPGWHEWVDQLEGDGIKVLCYVNSMFRDLPDDAAPEARNLFQEGLAAGHFVRDETGEAYMLPVTAFDVALLDLTNQAAREWMKEVIRDEMIDNARCSGWMADFAEALPFDAKLESGEPAAAFHNRYPVEWARLNREVVEENDLLGQTLFFSRSGFTGSPSQSLLMWEGDQLTGWDGFDGLRSALHGLLNGGFSGLSLNHSDTGGYTSVGKYGLGGNRDHELLARWTEMNAFTAVLRTHEGNEPDLNVQVYSDEASMEHFARFTQVYAALASYREGLFAEAAEKGYPVVRHLLLHYPDDPIAHTVDDQFLLGSELLVAPVLEPCGEPAPCDSVRDVYFPAGMWVHLWSGEEYGAMGAGVWAEVAAPMGQPAVFHRKGSVVGQSVVEKLQAKGL